MGDLPHHILYRHQRLLNSKGIYAFKAALCDELELIYIIDNMTNAWQLKSKVRECKLSSQLKTSKLAEKILGPGIQY